MVVRGVGVSRVGVWGFRVPGLCPGCCMNHPPEPHCPYGPAGAAAPGQGLVRSAVGGGLRAPSLLLFLLLSLSAGAAQACLCAVFSPGVQECSLH